MLKRIIPILLVDNQELIKTIKFDNPTYIGDVLNSIKIYNELQVDELCILDKSARQNEINFNLIKELAIESFFPLSYGGGIKDLYSIEKLLRLGVEKVVLCSEAFNYEFVQSAISNFGSSTITVCVDYKEINKEKIVFINNGLKNMNIEISKFVDKLVNIEVGEIIVQSIDNDGTYQGYDFDLLNELTNKFNNPFVISGGCKDLSDIYQAFKSNASGAAAGSLFVYYTNTKGILVNYPTNDELIENGIIR
jgi:cyclase